MLYEIAEWHIRKRPSFDQWLQLEQARDLLVKQRHDHIDIDVRFLKATYARQGQSGHNDHSKLLHSLCEEYFDRHCYLKGIACLFSNVLANVTNGVSSEQAFDDLAWEDEVLTKIGGEFLRQAQYIQSLGHSLLQAPHYGNALRSLELSFENQRHEFSPRNTAFLLLYLRQVYSGLGNVTKALFYAEKALEAFSKLYYYDDESDAALHVALAKADYRRQYEEGSDEGRQWMVAAIEFLAAWADKDRDHGNVDNEHEKCVQAALLEDYQREKFGDQDALHRAQTWKKRAERISPGQPKVLLNSIVDLDVRHMSVAKDFHGAVTLSKESYNYFIVSVKPTYHLAQACVRVAVSMSLQLSDEIQREGTDYNRESPHAAQLLEIAAYNVKGLKLYQSTGEPEATVCCTALYVGILLKYIAYDSASIATLMDHALSEIRKADELCDRSRRSLAAVGGLSILLLKRQLVSRHEHQKLYSRAVSVCLTLGDFKTAWNWIQKGKARALSDIFGTRASLPNSLTKQILANPDVLKLFDEEQMWNKQAELAGPEGYLEIAREAEHLRNKMRQIPILAQMLDIREGSYDAIANDTNLDQALNWTGIEASAVKYVDWFVSQHKDGTQDDILMFIRTLGGTTNVRRLPISIHTVKAWIEKDLRFSSYVVTPPLKRPNGNRILAELNGLLYGLDEYTQEGDLLILSPLGILQSLPLHGLQVGGQSLIARNLLIYSSCAAVFRQCRDRAAGQIAARNVKSTFLGVYEETSQQRLAERAQIFASIGKAGSCLDAEIHTGPSVTKDQFVTSAEKTHWLHYHGHAVYDSEDVTKSALLLSNGSLGNETLTSSDHSETYQLTVREVFNLNMFANAPHLTIIGCDSGTQSIGAGDEPLGLMSAFLYAGATSVIGCLWPVESSAGRVFSERFYENLKTQTESFITQQSQPKILNIAAAYKAATLEMMAKEAKSTRLPFFWAPFVLQGAWFRAWDTSSAE